MLCQTLKLLRFHHKPGARAPSRVGAGVVWSRVGTLASPVMEQLPIVAEDELVILPSVDACVAGVGVAT